VDRHDPDRTALIWAKNAPGEYARVSFGELRARVNRFGNALRRVGVQKGDRVCIYMGMTPDIVVAMLACARIGAIHSVVFGGFSAESLRDRIGDAGARVLVTGDVALRGAKEVPLKAIADAALSEGAGLSVETVFVARRGEAPVPMRAGRDVWMHEAMEQEGDECASEPMEAEDPLFMLYTSGSTGRPKGVVHSTGGCLVYAATTHAYVFDAKRDDLHFCAADCGWITGHSYVVYGPLCNGIATVLFESLPTFPDAGRYWQVCADLGVTLFYTAPTALRAVLAEGNGPVQAHDRSTLRLLGSVGEPINPEVWRWYHDVVGAGRCAVVDTWWQTETGGVMITTLPGVAASKPGSAGMPFFGVQPVLLDAAGAEVEGEGIGSLFLRGAWPGRARTVWGDHPRFLATYFAQSPGLYCTGDGARRDADGYWWITGRVDDVLNVAGHRIGTAEVESALVTHPAVAEAAVVGVPHDIKGTAIVAFVILKAGATASEDELVGVVRRVIGPVATPERVIVVPGLPKTRSGKIMRRILRKIASGETEGLGDVTTLADPGVVEVIAGLARG
jgi:acetyl-CoA synthetase